MRATYWLMTAVLGLPIVGCGGTGTAPSSSAAPTTAVEARQASAEFFSILFRAFPLLFVGNERPVLFAKGGDLQLVSIRVGKIYAAFSGRAQTVLRAKVALIGAAAGGN